jgi:hypothetical protein
VASRACDADACLRRALALLLLLGVLAVSRDMPTASASGIELLPMKLRWSIAWAGLHTTQSPLTPVAAHLALAMDPGLHTGLGRKAAGYLARNGAVRDRLRWSAALARMDRRSLPLLVRAVDAALETSDCELLHTAVRAARSLPRADRARVARKLRRALHQAQRRPTTRGTVAPCPM